MTKKTAAILTAIEEAKRNSDVPIKINGYKEGYSSFYIVANEEFISLLIGIMPIDELNELEVRSINEPLARTINLFEQFIF